MRKGITTKNKFNLLCKKCEKEFIIECTNYIFAKGKFKKYCSYECANSREWDNEAKVKKSLAALNSEKFKNANSLRKGKCKIYKDECLFCKKIIEHKGSKLRKYHKECWLKCCGVLKRILLLFIEKFIMELN